jgi:hypothetical protein
MTWWEKIGSAEEKPKPRPGTSVYADRFRDDPEQNDARWEPVGEIDPQTGRWTVAAVGVGAPRAGLDAARGVAAAVTPVLHIGAMNVLERCPETGRALPSVTKQPFANMEWSPISTRSTAATITPMLRKVPDPIRMRAVSGAVNQTCGSSRVCSPTSSRPSRNASSRLPWTGQRTKARLRANSRWMRARFQGSEFCSYQRHV